jgi:hypothetical protein
MWNNEPNQSRGVNEMTGKRSHHKKVDVNSPEAVAERYGGGLVKDPEIRAASKPPVIDTDENGIEIGRGPTCPFCTLATNAHATNCPIEEGGLEISSSLNDTLESRKPNG